MWNWSISGTMEVKEERVGELEETSVEMVQFELKGKKWREKQTNQPQEWKTTKEIPFCVIRVPEGKEGEAGSKKYLKK